MSGPVRRARAVVSVYRPTSQPTKAGDEQFMVIEGEVVEFGSFNYTAAVEKRNAENALMLHDPAVAQQDQSFGEQRGRPWGTP